MFVHYGTNPIQEESGSDPINELNLPLPVLGDLRVENLPPGDSYYKKNGSFQLWENDIFLLGFTKTRIEMAGVKETEETWKRVGPYFEELIGKIEPSFESLPDKDWKDSYKEHFKPWSFEGLHWVPVWEKDSSPIPEGDVAVWLDPGMAFGTGNHETTRLCIDAMIQFLKLRRRAGLVKEDLSCCDAGCGSGILAISARKMGLLEVVGFDIDPAAVRISLENTKLNQLVGALDFMEGDLDSGFQNKSFDLVFANILSAVLVKHPCALLTAVKPGGRLILSGILTKEVGLVKDTYLKKLERLNKRGRYSSHTLGEWSDIVIDLD